MFYVHGFASSPSSAKATYLGERCRRAGLRFHSPDFNEPSFETLTISRMLRQLDAAVAASGAARVVLVGSSLGGLVAWLAAEEWQGRRESRWSAEALVLLAPAFEFAGNRTRDLGDEGIRAWRDTGWREFHHFGAGGPRRVHYGLLTDAQGYEPERAQVAAPTLVLQGLRDSVVTPRSVQDFVHGRPNVSLVLLDDDHQLTASLPEIWSRMRDAIAAGAE